LFHNVLLYLGFVVLDLQYNAKMADIITLEDVDWLRLCYVLIIYMCKFLMCLFFHLPLQRCCIYKRLAWTMIDCNNLLFMLVGLMLEWQQINYPYYG